jgi:hypothetical protein
VNAGAQSVGSNVLHLKQRKKTYVHERRPQDAKNAKRANASDRMRKINCDVNDEQNVTPHVALALSTQKRPPVSIVLPQLLYNPTLIHAQPIAMPTVEILAVLPETRRLLGFAASHLHLHYLHLFNLLYWIFLLLIRLPKMTKYATTKAQLVSFAVAIVRNANPAVLKQRRIVRDASVKNCVDARKNLPFVIVRVEVEGMVEATKPITVLDMKDSRHRGHGMAELLEANQKEEFRVGSRKSLDCEVDDEILMRYDCKEYKTQLLKSMVDASTIWMAWRYSDGDTNSSNRLYPISLGRLSLPHPNS